MIKGTHGLTASRFRQAQALDRVGLVAILWRGRDKARVVVDGNLVSCAGVTAGLDGALVLVSLLQGDSAAEEIQLKIQYAPDPFFKADRRIRPGLK